MFSNPVPARVICDVIGLPPEDVPRLIELVADTGALLDGVTDLDGMSRAATAALDLSLYAQEQLEAARQRSAADRSGLLAVLVEAIEAGAVGPDEVRNMLVVLISAGSETTSSLLATAVETLARTPELQAHLRSSRDRIPGAIEDFLRDDGPFQFHYRWTTTDTALGGMHIPAQSRVLLLWAAANRPAPDEPIASDVADAATPAAHLAFGRGLHFCIGAPLARLESRVAIEQLLARTSAILLDPDHPPTQRPSIFIRRHKTLIINIARAA
jgi:cytochrome P450